MSKPNGTLWRKDFPMLARKNSQGRPLVYLDSAATGQKPNCVIDTITSFYRDHYGTVNRAVYELAAAATTAYQGVREKTRAFLNAKGAEEILFTRGTTESINLVATSFGKAFVHKGDEIIISEMEHHSNIVPWQMMCEDRGAVLRFIPVDESGQLRLDEYRRLLNARTRLVAVTHISNVLGTVNPIEQITTMAHKNGSKVLVDAAQSSPHVQLDVQKLGADFLTCSGHKLYGPTGIGILYGKAELLNAMPPYQGGGDMIDTVTFEKTTYNTLPLKFEAGTPMIAEVMGLGAALDYLTGVGLQNIHEWEHELLHYATKKLETIPTLRIIGTAPNKGALISFVIEGAHALDIGTLLDAHGIAVRTGHHCAQPILRRFGVKAATRISFGLYNTLEEIDQLHSTLKQILPHLR